MKQLCSYKGVEIIEGHLMPDHSQFEKIPMSLERQYNMLQEQLDDIERGIDDIHKSHGEQFTVKQLMKTRKSIQAKLDKLNDTKRKDTVINFEELGVDRLELM